MRETKFRGKKKDRNEWVYGYLLGTEDQKWIAEGYYKTHYEVIPETIGQYTGIKTKLGLDIYEGDYIKHNENVFIVGWEDKKEQAVFGLCLTEVKRYVNWRGLEWLNNVSKYVSVIGNFHDNPELLQQ